MVLNHIVIFQNLFLTTHQKCDFIFYILNNELLINISLKIHPARSSEMLFFSNFAHLFKEAIYSWFLMHSYM